MYEEMIPIVMFVVIGVIVIAYYYWNHKNRLSVMETVQKAIETGGELNTDLLNQLGAAVNPKIRDFRRGIIFLSLGVAGLLCSFFVPEVAADGVRAGSVFPLLIGAAFLLVWKLTKDDL